MKMICCFCEKDLEMGARICGYCNDYKGVMTVTEFEKIYGVSA